jgi:hypothetical protein
MVERLLDALKTVREHLFFQSQLLPDNPDPPFLGDGHSLELKCRLLRQQLLHDGFAVWCPGVVENISGGLTEEGAKRLLVPLIQGGAEVYEAGSMFVIDFLCSEVAKCIQACEMDGPWR